MKSSNFLLRLVDKCIPPGYLELDIYDIILRSRVTIIFVVLSGVTCFYIGFMVDSLGGSPASQAGMYVLGVAYVMLSVIFHFTGTFFVVANLYAVVCYIAIYFTSLSFGGPLQNPLMPLMLMVPLVTFIISGKYTGLFWTIFTALGFVITVMNPDLLPEEVVTVPALAAKQMQLLQMAAWVLLSIGFFSILYVYDLMNNKLRYVISEERNHYAYEAGHDKLTGLLNRASFQQRLALNVESAKVNRSLAIIGLIDLDGFKPVNDQIGHHAGDIVLKEISAKLKQGMNTTDTLARLGGDEFAFVLPDAKSRNDVDERIQSMLEAIAEPIIIDGQTIQISGSIGLARCPDDHSEPYEVLRAADEAMYAAKNVKGHFCYFHELQEAVAITG